MSTAADLFACEDDELMSDEEFDALFTEDPEHEIGCDFPDECLMPGEHLRSECHTIEMIEAQKREGLEAQLGFYIEQRGSSHVVQYASGGCRPATDAELTLWDALWQAT